ncbi:hypothetical protein LIER_05739 [Lithospermum erythrorhizon]|uniref:Uncharacterized protein n=1 Tax=Lithospermum erythrorhizon TaxID=34254 RepID=A0AAV3P1W2_LITER
MVQGLVPAAPSGEPSTQNHCPTSISHGKCLDQGNGSEYPTFGPSAKQPTPTTRPKIRDIKVVARAVKFGGPGLGVQLPGILYRNPDYKLCGKHSGTGTTLQSQGNGGVHPLHELRVLHDADNKEGDGNGQEKGDRIRQEKPTCQPLTTL